METIYVALLNENVEVWRPVKAEREGGLYRIVSAMPDNEAWEFEPGSVVRCESREMFEGPALAAVAAG